MCLEIVPMELRHIPDLALLEKQCFAHPWSAAALKEELLVESAVFLVAERAGLVLGYAGMHLVCGDGYIANIAVFPQHRGKGAAKALLRALEGRCTGFLTLEVRESNKAARSLYRSMGFAELALRKKYYTDPVENAIICTKEVRAHADTGN